MLLQTVPGDFEKRFRGEIPREIKLETRNGRSYTVEVAKYPDKLVLRAGWEVFVETYNLQIDDSVVFRYNGNSQFKVIVFDLLGGEKALSVVADNAALSTYVQERHIGTPETLGGSRGHSQPPEMQSPADNLNHYQGHVQSMRMHLPTGNMRCSEGHAQPASAPMQMLSPTQPMQMQPPTETLNNSIGNPQSVQMQSVRRDNSSLGNKTFASSSGTPSRLSVPPYHL